MNLTLPTLESAGHTLRTSRGQAHVRRVIKPGRRAGLCGVGMALLLLGVPAQASAELITLRFTGTVTMLPVNPVPGFESAAIGNPVAGLILFDTSVPDLQPDPRDGLYEGSIRRFSMSVGDAALSVTGPIATSAVNDAAGIPPIDLVGFGAANSDNTIQLLAQFLSQDDVIQGDSIPLDPAVYMRFADRRFRILHVPDFDVSPRGLFGTIDSVSIAAAPVPEPGTLLLAATGAGLIARMSRRGRKRE